LRSVIATRVGKFQVNKAQSASKEEEEEAVDGGEGGFFSKKQVVNLTAAHRAQHQ